MSLLHDHDIEADAPARARDLDRDRDVERGPASDVATRSSPGGRTDLGAPSPPGEVAGDWGTLMRVGHRGGMPRFRSSVARLQGAAGNAAVAGLLGPREGGARATRRVGPTLIHAGGSDVPGTEPNAAGDEDKAPIPLDGVEDTAPAKPPPTSSSTKVGPPSASSYTVSGTLREAANAVAARPEAGATITTPDMNMPADDRWPTHVQVTVTQVVVLPEWDGKTAATQDQRDEWDRFKAAITAHENGHVAKDVKAFANAHVKVKAKKTRAEGEAEFDAIITQANTDNDTYDADTDHGRPATNINPNLGEVTKIP
jgi:hypothetical protein